MYPVLALFSECYPRLLGRLPTCYSPVRRYLEVRGWKLEIRFSPTSNLYPPTSRPLDLHVLSTPPAFVLSQDQTLQLKLSKLGFRLVLITVENPFAALLTYWLTIIWMVVQVTCGFLFLPAVQFSMILLLFAFSRQRFAAKNINVPCSFALCKL